uniref:Uncharacterized protein n=1 Tax=Romanomermis culicivorax TaxID=13658 RepID=A0A915KSM8_ROMCU
MTGSQSLIASNSDLDVENLFHRIYTKPGRIAPGPLVHREPTPHIVRPFRVSQSQPPTPRNSNLVTDAQDSASTTNGHHQNQDSEIHKLYAQQSKRLREMMADLEPKDQRISQLERDLSSLALKLESLQNDVKLKDEDIESLRYEIAWKNKRISQLEQQLYDKETKN